MDRSLILTALLLILVPRGIRSQERQERALFQEAESWLVYEEYAEALPFYDTLLQMDPGNDLLQFKVGVCLLNDPYGQELAITHLEDAARGMRRHAKENSYSERRAPPDAVYYLAIAYLANGRIREARETFEAFLIIMDREVYDEALVRHQIAACDNALKMMQQPVEVSFEWLDSTLNSPYPEIRPVLSGDGSTLAFVRKLPFYDAAFVCHRTATGWTYPRNITQELGFDADVYPVGLSYDGTEMILSYEEDRIGNLYLSRLLGEQWAKATVMGEPVSTKYWESHGCLSRDGNTLYFTSNREGTLGGLDIYLSRKMGNGNWGEPENLGPVVNSIYNEQAPWISPDGQTLCFCSFGHQTMGGYDIFFSSKDSSGKWGEPVHLGYPVNTTGDDLYFQPAGNGDSAIFSMFRPNGTGLHDLCLVKFGKSKTLLP